MLVNLCESKRTRASCIVIVTFGCQTESLWGGGDGARLNAKILLREIKEQIEKEERERERESMMRVEGDGKSRSAESKSVSEGVEINAPPQFSEQIKRTCRLNCLETT